MENLECITSDIAPTNGVHYIVDVFGYNLDGDDTPDWWQNSIVRIFDNSPFEVLHHHFYGFKPHGVTGYLLLSTSHFSIHTWPEHDYITIDLFSCLGEEVTKPILDKVLSIIPHERHDLQMFRRGYQPPEIAGVFLNPIYSTGRVEHIKISQIICQIQTEHQKIEVFDSPKFDRVLAIDGVVQATESDHHLYDAVFISALCEKHRRVLILGGGDGFVAQSALKMYPCLEITVVEIDAEVIKVCRHYFEQKVFEDQRVKLIIGDAGEYLRQCQKSSFDAIFFDLTDTPLCSEQDTNSFYSFYKDGFKHAAALLAPNGQVVVQAGASQVTSDYINSANILSKVMKSVFEQTSERRIFIPSFGEECSFLSAR